MAKTRSSVEQFDAEVRRLADAGKSSREIARHIGINRQSVLDYMKSVGIQKLPRKDVPRNEFIDYEGKRYVWNSQKGYWRCSSGNRENLAKVIYKKLHPEYVEMKNDCFHFVNGDKRDFTRGNIELVRIEDVPGRFLRNNEERRLLCKAFGIAQLELQRLKEIEHPELKKQRIKKALDTLGKEGIKARSIKTHSKFTKEMYLAKGRKAAETKRINNETRKRLGAA